MGLLLLLEVDHGVLCAGVAAPSTVFTPRGEERRLRGEVVCDVCRGFCKFPGISWLLMMAAVHPHRHGTGLGERAGDVGAGVVIHPQLHPGGGVGDGMELPTARCTVAHFFVLFV